MTRTNPKQQTEDINYHHSGDAMIVSQLSQEGEKWSRKLLTTERGEWSMELATDHRGEWSRKLLTTDRG